MENFNVVTSTIVALVEDSLGDFAQMGGPGSGHWGHRGRKGKRGGSARSRAGALAKLSAPVEDRGKTGLWKMSMWINNYGGVSHWQDATSEERSELKAQVARDLAEASGVSEQEASDFVRQWAESSNDDDMRSLAIQQDAAKEFGLKTSKFTQDKIDTINARRERVERVEAGKEEVGFFDKPAESLASADLNPLMESDKQRAILRSMYDKTQAELKARGIEEVKLYRGVRLPSTVERSLSDRSPITTNAIESWSVSRKEANKFAGLSWMGAEDEVGVILETVVPAERILATPATGFGCLTEGEVVVLGGIGGDTAKAQIKRTMEEFLE